MPKKKKEIIPNNSFTEFLLYTTPNGKVKLEIFLRDENIWLTQEKIALLFGVKRPAITKHLKNIFESGELSENSVSSILEHTAKVININSTYLKIPASLTYLQSELESFLLVMYRWVLFQKIKTFVSSLEDNLRGSEVLEVSRVKLGSFPEVRYLTDYICYRPDTWD